MLGEWYIYIYMCVCVCACVRACVNARARQIGITSLASPEQVLNIRLGEDGD